MFYYEQLLLGNFQNLEDLGNEDIKKVIDPEDNKRISKLFALFSGDAKINLVPGKYFFTHKRLPKRLDSDGQPNPLNPGLNEFGNNLSILVGTYYIPKLWKKEK